MAPRGHHLQRLPGNVTFWTKPKVMTHWGRPDVHSPEGSSALAPPPGPSSQNSSWGSSAVEPLPGTAAHFPGLLQAFLAYTSTRPFASCVNRLLSDER